jgi:hypothetical protein
MIKNNKSNTLKKRQIRKFCKTEGIKMEHQEITSSVDESQMSEFDRFRVDRARRAIDDGLICDREHLDIEQVRKLVYLKFESHKHWIVFADTASGEAKNENLSAPERDRILQ